MPGSAGIILNDAHEQTQHRMALERKLITDQSRRADLGQRMAFTIALVTLAIAGCLIYAGHDAAGGIIAATDLVALAAVFIRGRGQQDKALAERQSDAPRARSEEN